MQFDNKTTRSVADAVALIMSGKKAEVVQESVEQLQEYESKDGVYKHEAKKGRYGGSDAPTDPFAGVRGPGKKDIDKIEAEKKKKKVKGKFTEMVATYQETGLKALEEAWGKKKKVMKEEPDNAQFTAELEKQKKKAAGTADESDKAKVAAAASQGCVEVKEETEQLDELSKTTLNNYVDSAKQDNKDHADSRRSGDAEESKWAKDRFVKRNTGMGAAKQRLNKEETEEVVEEELKGNQHKIDKNKNNKIDAHDFKLLRKEESEELDERTLTASETEKKEEIVKSMKKGMAGFKERYGDRAKSVMYATATKQAKGE